VARLAGNSAGFADGTGSAAAFRNPTGVACDPTGERLFVVDFNAHAVRLVFLRNSSVVTLGGNGTAGFANAPGRGARFNNPYAAAALGSSELAVTDFNNHRVRLVALGVAEVEEALNPLGAATSTLAGSGACATVDGPLATAQLCNPRGIAADAARGLVYFTETNGGGGRVRRIVLGPGAAIVTLAGSFASAKPVGPTRGGPERVSGCCWASFRRAASLRREQGRRRPSMVAETIHTRTHNMHYYMVLKRKELLRRCLTSTGSIK
jgi:hypothetical protein